MSQQIAEHGISTVDLENVKPASNVADYKSVAAMVGLRQSAVRGFEDVSGLWVGQLMAHGLVFHDKMTDSYILSFGFYEYAGMSWELKALPEDGNYFQVSEKEMDPHESRVRLQFFTTSRVWSPADAVCEEEFSGVPTEVCF